jgi:iron complex transport system permease protein
LDTSLSFQANKEPPSPPEGGEGGGEGERYPRNSKKESSPSSDICAPPHPNRADAVASAPPWRRGNVLDTGALITIALALLALLFAAISFSIGPAHIGVPDLFSGLFAQHGTATIIAREIRLPRALLALVVGAALGASGAALQGLFRNPLADPGVTGVTSSAGFGAVVAMYFGFAALNPLVLPACAIAGAVATSTILYFLSRAGAGRTSLILAGAAIASLATAMTALAMSLAPNPYAMAEMMRWMMGSLKDCTLSDLALATPPVVIGIALLMSTARSLDALVLGEEAAHSLGVNVHGVRRRVVIGVALATGAATAAAGAVSFVGLVVPHLLRPFYAYEPARLILPSALGGAVLVSAADIAVRLIAPDGQLLVGVMTAMIGAPFFIWLIVRMRRET